MKKICLLLFTFIVFMMNSVCIYAEGETGVQINAPSAILMDYSTGTILYEKNADEKRPLASVTKIMTMLIAMEEIDDGNLGYDDIIIGSEHAKSMGGSTIFLDAGEQMTVSDILKGIAVASGNDAAVAMGEHISGTEELFVERMNKKAAELNMTNTNFVNSNGLDAEGHYSTARDIALMSRELMKHEDIFGYTGIWMDSLRNGEFTLSNTNKLIRFYEGATGLKTGSTSKAGFCISATAKRDNMHLIAVIMGAETSKSRQADASALLNYGFSNYKVESLINEKDIVDEIKVHKGTKQTVSIFSGEDVNLLSLKNQDIELSKVVDINKNVTAPIKQGDVAGTVTFIVNNQEYKKINLYYTDSIPKISFAAELKKLIFDWIG